ncbi:MAG TPA: hypothetical protein VFQ65_04435 [Kofleriaceae bacterium]|nr:hypothetical protein [Kofleriaceae bacterium]
MRLGLVIILLAACGNGGGNASRDALIAAWKTGGLAPSAFTAVKDSPVGNDCQAGTVNNVDVMVCSYPTPDAAKAAQDLGLKWVGDTTGIATPKGSLLIVAADRKKADTKGTTINQLVKLAP